MLHTIGLGVRVGALLALSLLAACGGGGGGGSTPQPSPVAANVPVGSGQVAIQMIGTWQIFLASVIDTNDAGAQPPANGTTIVIGPDGVASIGGLTVKQADLELLLGLTLSLYVNKIDGKTVLYGLSFDRRVQGGNREVVGLAGGALDDNTISVEQFTSTQSPSAAEAVYVRSRYKLARVSNAIVLPANVSPQTAPATAAGLRDVLPPLFGR